MSLGLLWSQSPTPSIHLFVGLPFHYFFLSFENVFPNCHDFSGALNISVFFFFFMFARANLVYTEANCGFSVSEKQPFIHLVFLLVLYSVNCPAGPCSLTNSKNGHEVFRLPRIMSDSDRNCEHNR
ncbi:hypothetical protein EGW08_004293 [Elysia chlorotica]|uniref:Uncharacterized protein n=1 Tax=Elysia chlorotica TaxID=188477 RepID=A0A3S1BGP8_ELYCH|nr:hypothetical protein EGW08_004293 [Elysia chlorotica]